MIVLQLSTSQQKHKDIPRGPQADMFPAVKTPMLPDGTFNNKVAFVTGGGTGIGKAVSEMLSQLGGKVVISSRYLELAGFLRLFSTDFMLKAF